MRKRIDERRGFAAAYREGLGLAAIAVVGDAGGIRIVSLKPGEDGARCAADSAPARWWCRRAEDAARVAAAAAKRLRREFSDTDQSAAAAAVVAAAKRLDIALHSDEDVADEAMNVAARVDAQLQQQQKSGGLKSVNAAYRSYRLDSSARGERVLRYDEWMHRYRANLVRQIASALRQL